MKIEEEIQSRFRNVRQKALVNLHYTQLAIDYRTGMIFKEYDISGQQYNVLRILRGQYPKAASIGLIKERMLDKGSDVSRIIDRLVKKSLVSRKECKADRRQKDVLISKKGLSLLESMEEKNEDLDGLLGALSDDEAEILNGLLDKLRDGL